MVKTGQTWSGLVVTKDATGALATPSVGPAGVLYVDGIANAASVTISGSNPYKWTVTLPALSAGQCVSMYITATIATIATGSVVAEDVADTVRLSDGTLQTGDAYAVVAHADYGNAKLVRSTTPANTLDIAAGGEASANVTMQQGVTVAAADANGNIPVDVRAWRGEDVQPTAVSGVPDINLAYIDTVVGGMQGIRDANKLAPTAGAPAAGSVDKHLDDILAVAPDNKPTVAAMGEIAADVKKWQSDPVNDAVDGFLPVSGRSVADALLLAPSGAAAAGSAMDYLADILEDTGTTLPGLIAGVGAAGDPWSTALPGAYGAGTAGALLSGIDSNVDLLLAVDTSTSDATTAGAISRRRGNSWAIPLTIGAITGYTSLWFTIKSSYDDADTSALVQVKLNSPSALDGLLYVNGTTASSAALGSITVSDAATGEIVVNVDETITDDLAPGTYYYDVQTLIAGAVATPDSGTFTVTADVTRSVA